MMNEFITAGIGIVSTTVASWVTWVLARKKYNSEVDHNVIENMKESLEFYQLLSTDNKTRLTEALEENKKLRDALNKLSQENISLRKDLDEVKTQVIKLSTSICYDLSCKIRQREVETLKPENNEEGNAE